MTPQSGSILTKARLVLRIVLFAIVAIAASLAALENTHAVRLSLLGYQSPELSVFWWLLIALGIGIILGRVIRTGRRS
jgi:hypothetical protein